MTADEPEKARGCRGKRGQKQAQRGRQRAVTPDYLERAGLYYLQRFASSVTNFRRVMLRKVHRRGLPDGVSAEAAEGWIDDLVTRFVRAGLLDDQAYAVGRAQSMHRQGRPARYIRQALAAKGVSAVMIDDVIAAQFPDTDKADLHAAIAYARRRRLGPFHREGAPGNPDSRRRMLAALARAGFTYGTAAAVIDAEDEAALDELLTKTA